MSNATKIKVTTRLGGGIVEQQFAESVREAAKLARQTKRDWQRYTKNRVEVSYFGRNGKETYIR